MTAFIHRPLFAKPPSRQLPPLPLDTHLEYSQIRSVVRRRVDVAKAHHVSIQLKGRIR
jgi:hypothetical protein